MRIHRTSPFVGTLVLLASAWMALRFGRAFLAQASGAFGGLGH